MQLIIEILEATVLGILTGSVYALMASGMTLIFGVMEVINIAQGIIVILGAYLSYSAQQLLHLEPFLGLLLTMPIMFVVGYGIERVCVRPIKQQRLVFSLLAMYAAGLVIEGLLGIVYSTTSVEIQAPYADASIRLSEHFYLPIIYLYLCALSVVLLLALYFVIYRTKFGQSVRAAMQNRTAATLIGIDVERVSALTFGIGIALAAAGGMAYGVTSTFNISSAGDLVPRLLVIIVLGGMGSLTGALIGSVVMLIIWNITTVVWDPLWSSTVFFLFLVVLLLFRPQGLLGRPVGRQQ